MKSVFNKIEEEKSKEIEFPVLAEALVEGETFVVLFLSNNIGVVVKGDSQYNVGEYDETFINVANKTHWRILSSAESIVLSND